MPTATIHPAARSSIPDPFPPQPPVPDPQPEPQPPAPAPTPARWTLAGGDPDAAGGDDGGGAGDDDQSDPGGDSDPQPVPHEQVTPRRFGAPHTADPST